MDVLLGLLWRFLCGSGLIRVAAMTGPARYFILVIKIFSFDIAQHPEHLARCFFGRLIILVPFVLRVAIGAGNAERAPYGIHGKQYLGRRFAFEYLDALVNIFGAHRAIQAQP